MSNHHDGPSHDSALRQDQFLDFEKLVLADRLPLKLLWKSWIKWLGRLLHPRRDVAFAVKHAPNIDVVSALEIEHEIGIAAQRPKAQAGKVELASISR